jgi:hypothetical protein
LLNCKRACAGCLTDWHRWFYAGIVGFIGIFGFINITGIVAFINITGIVVCINITGMVGSI